jgi:formate hydrogenlyase subunit 6/NADH:ubiquinone oxidoreductase subunit I
MLKLLREVLKVGEATIPYPFVPAEVTPGFRGKPHHDPELCIACAACAIACPSNALELSNDLDQGIRTWSLFMGLCVYCARCEEVCPTGSIRLSQDFELAVMNREDLFERSDYRLAACRRCGKYFAPVKEIEHMYALMQVSSLPAESLENARLMLEICPECKRENDIPKLVALYRRQSDAG